MPVRFSSIPDTLLTHVKGIFTQHPDWLPRLAGLYAEGAVMTGDWDAVRSAIQSAHIATPEITIANLLLALRTRDPSNVSAAFKDARNALGAPLTVGGRQSYRHLYGTVIHLHIVHELQMIYSSDISLTLPRSPTNSTAATVDRLTGQLAARFERTQPSYTAREPILSMRRTGFGIWCGG
jgi:serine/threonine-protein kinase ATR